MTLTKDTKKMLQNKRARWVFREFNHITLAWKHPTLKKHMVVTKYCFNDESSAREAEEYFMKYHKVKR